MLTVSKLRSLTKGRGPLRWAWTRSRDSQRHLVVRREDHPCWAGSIGFSTKPRGASPLHALPSTLAKARQAGKSSGKRRSRAGLLSVRPLLKVTQLQRSLHLEYERVATDERRHLVIGEGHAHDDAVAGGRNTRLTQELCHVRIFRLGLILFVEQTHLQQLPQRIGVLGRAANTL